MPDPVVALVPAPAELAVEHLAAEPGRLIVVATARRAAAVCPACGCPSDRVQSRYERSLADLPWHGLAVALRVRARRFVCDVPRCPRRVFCERLPGTAAAYARRTTRLAGALELIGLALGGEAGARLAGRRVRGGGEVRRARGRAGGRPLPPPAQPHRGGAARPGAPRPRRARRGAATRAARPRAVTRRLWGRGSRPRRKIG